MTDTTEKDFDLDVVFAGIAPRYSGGRKWRFRTRSERKPSLYTYLYEYASGMRQYARYSLVTVGNLHTRSLEYGFKSSEF